MDRYPAITTETDRDHISGESDPTDSQRYQAISRVRSRIQRLKEDKRFLEEHHPQLCDELLEAVCGE